MARHAALLRGINVGGSKKVPMAELRDVLEGLGYGDVETILQSGNAVFSASKPEAAEIESAIADRFGFDVRVLLRTHADLRRLVEDNPFPDALEVPKNLHVWFLDRPTTLELDEDLIAPDAVAAGTQELYVWYRHGMASSKVAKHVTEKRLGVTATARNWNTVLKLADLTA